MSWKISLLGFAASVATLAHAGFDFDSDGIDDIAEYGASDSGQTCAGRSVFNRTVTIRSGATHAILTRLGPVADHCFPNLYPVISLGSGTLHFGAAKGLLVLAPQYGSTAWWVYKTATGAATFALYTPQTSAFSTYQAAGAPRVNSQPFNGLVINRNGATEYVAFTSGRALRYSFSPLNAAQLLADVPFKARPDIGGRTYGLLTHDPQRPGQIFLLAGGAMWSLHRDALIGTRTQDPWAALERHVTRYDANTNAIQQRFLSYAYDNDRADQYQNRLLFPSSATLPTNSPYGSQMIFNLFKDGIWSIHITTPGGVESRSITPNMVVWDVVRRDATTVDIVTSPTNGYFPKFETVVYRWTAAKPKFTEIKRIPGQIPTLRPGPNRTFEASHEGVLWSTAP
ncbi:MAG: hypothetical protein AB7F86_11995 [Bdellovibrionales bacterium]